MSATALPLPGRATSARVLPGLPLSLGFTLTYLGLLVIVPLVGVFAKAATLGPAGLWHELSEPRVLAALRLSFGGALLAVLINLALGPIVAWVFVRYRFFGKRLWHAMVDLPFALPTSVAGISLSALYGPHGWLGQPLNALGIKVAYTPLGVIVAMVFIGLPFLVRTLEPALEQAERMFEEAAATLGANRWQTVTRVILPTVAPALISGTAMAFARAVGEYGSIIFIAGNLPGISEIAPLLIMIRLEEYDYAGATAIAGVMLVASFLILGAINALQFRARRADRR
jgi:sulfate transport system permease protein